MNLERYAKEALSYRRVEFNITNRCNHRCPNCHQLANQLPAEYDLSIMRVRSFLHASLSLGRPMALVTLIGGEPTLHPGFSAILDSCIDYQNQVGGTCRLMISTNGTAPYIQRQRALEFLGFEEVSFEDRCFPNEFEGLPTRLINNSHKDQTKGLNNTTLHFHDPKECGLPDNSRSFTCPYPAKCGLHVTGRGIFPCAAAYTMARICCESSPITHLDQVTPSALAAMMRGWCQHCGAPRESPTPPDFNTQFSAFWRTRVARRLEEEQTR